jgi:hypothetical protein
MFRTVENNGRNKRQGWMDGRQQTDQRAGMVDSRLMSGFVGESEENCG